MNYEAFTYPHYNFPLLEAFDGKYECIFVIFHPFIRLPESISMKLQEYPSDEIITKHGKRINWSWIAKQARLTDCSKVNHALLTSIKALKQQYCDENSFARLNQLLDTHPIWYPTEGQFEPILHKVFKNAFQLVKAQKVIYVPEFPSIDSVEYYDIHEFVDIKITEFPSRGTLISSNSNLLFTVDWDSFFTLCYGNREQLTLILERNNLEGFFAGKTHSHWWYRQKVDGVINA